MATKRYTGHNNETKKECDERRCSRPVKSFLPSVEHDVSHVSIAAAAQGLLPELELSGELSVLVGELVHLAANPSAAEDWLTRHGYPEAELQDVTSPAPDAGRAA